MTFQETNKNSRDLFCRNNLTYDETIKRLEKYFEDDETIKRLEKYFTEQEITNIMISVDSLVSWTDGHIAVICTDKTNKIYTIVAFDIYRELIEP